jgi:hypothetical protein
MPTPTYTPLATVTLGTTATSVTFSNIPATYRDLIFVAAATANNFGDSTYRINGDTGSNYTSVFMYGAGPGNLGSGTNSTVQGFNGFFGSTIGDDIIQFMDYSATDKHKTLLSRSGVGDVATAARAGRWASTSAITSFTYYAGTLGANNFLAGSTFSLYGVIA